MGKDVGRPRTEWIDDFPPKNYGLHELKWVGYRNDLPLSVLDEPELLQEAFALHIPRERKIPRELLQLQVPGYWFQVHEDTLERPHSPNPIGLYNKKRELLFSESYQAITTELEERGILEDYLKMQERIKQINDLAPKKRFPGSRISWITGDGWEIHLRDKVTDPDGQKTLDELKAYAKLTKKEPREISLDNYQLRAIA